MKLLKALLHTVLALAALSACLGAGAQEAVIRKNLAERVPQMPKIDEVSKTPMPGLYELRVNGSDILYTDASGNFLIQGSLIDAICTGSGRSAGLCRSMTSPLVRSIL